MKSFFIYFLVFIVSLSGLSVLLSVPVSAASPYDNYIHNAIPPYQIKSSNNSLTSQFDDWGQLLDYVGTNYETRLAQGNSFCGNSITETQFSTILDLLNGGGKFLVGQTNANNITFYVNTNPADTITHTWYNDGMGGVYDNYNSSTSSFISFFITIANNGNRPICGSYTGTPDIGSMSSGDIIVSTLPFTIPSPDYEGEIPNTINNATNVYPLVSYTVDTDNTVNALNSGVFEDVCINVGNPTSGCAIPNIAWYITDDANNVINSFTNGLKAPYTFKLPGNGTFYLHATYSLPPPFLLPSPDINLVTTRIQIDANGTFQKGGTGVNECSIVSGIYECEPADPLEDCSTYGLDVGGYFQCIINNFGIWLRNTLINLFVPSYSFFSTWTTSFGEFLNTKLGFVYSSFAMITSLFGGIISSGINTSCTLTTSGTLFGAPFSVDVCNFQEIVGNTVWGIVQGLVISLTILALAFAGYRKYLEVVDHR